MRPAGSGSVIAGGGQLGGATRFARHVAIPLLADLTRLTDTSGQRLDCKSLMDLVRRSSVPGSDVRVLVDDVDQHRDDLCELADSLQCDVYCVGPGCTLTEIAGEIAACDRATGEAAEWTLIRPTDVPHDAPTWFDRGGGRLRVRSGLVTLPLATGLAFASRSTFLDMVRYSAQTQAHPLGATPVAVDIHSGCFSIAWYSGAEATLGGEEMARLLAASIDSIEPDLVVSLIWPEAESERDQLHGEIQLLAEALDRTVWVPDPARSAGHVADPGVAPIESLAEWVAFEPPSRPSTPADLESHRRIMRQADLAFRGLRFDVPSEAEQIRRAAEVWATYVGEYEHTHAAADSTDLGDLEELRAELGDLVGEVAPVDGDDGTGAPGPALFDDVQLADLDDLSFDYAPRWRADHRVAWLPRHPIVNSTAMTLYCWMPASPERASTEGIPASDPFIVGRRNIKALARAATTGCVLRLDVPPATAIRLSVHADALPARLQHRAREAADLFLIPVTWLQSVRLHEWYRVDGAGRLAEGHRPDDPRLLVSFQGADHGVPGLPNTAVRWPDRRGGATAVLTLPDDPQWIQARLTAFPGWLPLQRRPSAAGGLFRVLVLDIGQRAALDVPATMAAFAQAPIAPSSLASLTGVDLALPARSFPAAIITEVREPTSRGGRGVRHELVGQPLSSALPESAGR